MNLSPLGVKIPISNDTSAEYCSMINYENILPRVTNICQQWLLHNLTLMGKVLVVNTLIASLFVYKMQVLPNLTQQYIENVCSIVRSFIWNSKKAKITDKLLTVDKKYGGLRLVNLTHRQNALKIQWITIVNGDIFWETMCFSNLKINIGKIIWQCNFKDKHVQYIANNHSIFWTNVLEAWASYNFSHPVSPEDVSSQILWNNSYILIDNKPFVFLHAFNSGLIRVGQLYNLQGYPKTHQEIAVEFHFTHFQ